jgi:hypothetical protein
MAVSLQKYLFLFSASNKRERKGTVSHSSILADILHVLASQRLHRLLEFADIWMHTRYRGETVPDNEYACVGKTSSKTLKRNYRRMFVTSQATQPTSRIPWGRQEKITQPKILWKETNRLHLINVGNVETCSPVIR